MIAVRRFTGVVEGSEKVFRPGDHVTEAEAKEMSLASKPGLAQKEPVSAKSAKA